MPPPANCPALHTMRLSRIITERIARSLRAEHLVAREVTAEDLRPARESLETLRDDESARPDIRRAAAFAVFALAQLLGGS